MSTLIDWVTIVVPCHNSGWVDGGTVTAVRASGEIEWSTIRRLSVVGSHDSSVQVRSIDRKYLEISGNLGKWLQGHNLLGSPDMPRLCWAGLRALVEVLDLSPTMGDYEAWAAGDFRVRRVDVTRMFDLGTQERVNEWLAAAGRVARTRHQRGSMHGSTVYIGQHSRRKALKFYDKATEMRRPGHRLPTSLPAEVQDAALAWAVGKLRVEVVLRGKELDERGWSRASVWTPQFTEWVFDENLAGVELMDTLVLSREVVQGMPGRFKGVYHAWRAGEDLRQAYSRPTFYRYRKALLAFGIDIADVQPGKAEEGTQYILGEPLRSVLVGPGVAAPPWMRLAA